MDYSKPALRLAGSAKVLILGFYPGNGDSSMPTAQATKPVPLALGLDD